MNGGNTTISIDADVDPWRECEILRRRIGELEAGSGGMRDASGTLDSGNMPRIAALRAENENLRRENADLMRDGGNLRRENTDLRREIEALRREIVEKDGEISSLRRRCDDLEGQVRRLRERPAGDAPGADAGGTEGTEGTDGIGDLFDGFVKSIRDGASKLSDTVRDGVSQITTGMDRSIVQSKADAIIACVGDMGFPEAAGKVRELLDEMELAQGKADRECCF